jgi:hypothetical protein
MHCTDSSLVIQNRGAGGTENSPLGVKGLLRPHLSPMLLFQNECTTSCAPTRQNKDLAKIIIYIVLLGKQPVSGSIFRASKENPRYYWRPHRRIWIDIAGACLIPKVRDYFF